MVPSHSLQLLSYLDYIAVVYPSSVSNKSENEFFWNFYLVFNIYKKIGWNENLAKSRFIKSPKITSFWNSKIPSLTFVALLCSFEWDNKNWNRTKTVGCRIVPRDKKVSFEKTGVKGFFCFRFHYFITWSLYQKLIHTIKKYEPLPFQRQ